MVKEEKERSFANPSQQHPKARSKRGHLKITLAYLYRVTRTISTYDHRSVRTGHPVRNHEVSLHVDRFNKNPGNEGVVIPGTWITRDS